MFTVMEGGTSRFSYCTKMNSSKWLLLKKTIFWHVLVQLQLQLLTTTGSIFNEGKQLFWTFFWVVCFDKKARCFLRFSLTVCFLPQAALQAGLDWNVSNAVTVATVGCVTLWPETVPAAWAGLALTVIKVTHTLVTGSHGCHLWFVLACSIPNKSLM